MIFIFGTGYHGRAAFRVCKKLILRFAFLDNDKKNK